MYQMPWNEKGSFSCYKVLKLWLIFRSFLSRFLLLLFVFVFSPSFFCALDHPRLSPGLFRVLFMLYPYMHVRNETGERLYMKRNTCRAGRQRNALPCSLWGLWECLRWVYGSCTQKMLPPPSSAVRKILPFVVPSECRMPAACPAARLTDLAPPAGSSVLWLKRLMQKLGCQSRIDVYAGKRFLNVSPSIEVE